MSEGPWIRFFPSDWLAGTRGMTAAETGIYITLVAMMYERGGPIPYDVGRLSRLCGTTTAALKSTLATLIDERKITVDDEGLWNERVGAETEIRRDKSTSAREAAEARWQKEQEKQRKADANAKRAQRVGNANQNQSRTSSDEDVSRAKSTARSELAKVLDPEHVDAVLEHRKAKGGKFTAYAAKRLANQLAQWPDPNEAADEMIDANWNGFKVPWMERRMTTRGQDPPGGGKGQWQRYVQAFKDEADEQQGHDDTGPHGVVLSLPGPRSQRQ